MICVGVPPEPRFHLLASGTSSVALVITGRGIRIGRFGYDDETSANTAPLSRNLTVSGPSGPSGPSGLSGPRFWLSGQCPDRPSGVRRPGIGANRRAAYLSPAGGRRVGRRREICASPLSDALAHRPKRGENSTENPVVNARHPVSHRPCLSGKYLHGFSSVFSWPKVRVSTAVSFPFFVQIQAGTPDFSGPTSPPAQGPDTHGHATDTVWTSQERLRTLRTLRTARTRGPREAFADIRES